MSFDKRKAPSEFLDIADATSQSYKVFEGWTDAESQLQTRSGNVSFQELQNFLNSSHDYAIPDQANCKHLFRVLSISCFKGGRTKLFLPKESFERVRECWNLHDLTAEIFVNNNGLLTKFDMTTTSCIMMKVAASQSIGMDGVSISQNRKDGITNVLYHRLKDEKSIFNVLQESPERCSQPSFHAAVLYRSHQQRVEVYRQQVNEEIARVEHLTKFGGPGRLFEQRYKHDMSDPAALDSESAIKKLSYIQTELAVIGHVARSSLETGQWLLDLARQDRTSPPQQNNNLPNQKSEQLAMQKNKTKTLNEIEYTTRCSKTLLSQLLTIKDRVDSQTNFVSSH